MIWRWDFPFFLSMATLITGVVYWLDAQFWSKHRPAGEAHIPVVVDWCRSFFPVLLLVWAVRSFWVQPYRVPSGSLEPTVLQGDFMLATQFNYGVFFPVGHVKLFDTGKPKIGDIALFHPPSEAHTDVLLVKRVIGLPGDRIQYRNKQLTVNGQLIEQQYEAEADNYIGMSGHWEKLPAKQYQEDLFGVKHAIFVDSMQPAWQDIDLVVPEGHYFMMGDNRDYSNDSRYWGPVPEDHLIGKAWRIVMSWNPFEEDVPWYRLDKKIRWDRLGTKL